jgi:hypothetical protein
MALKQIKAELQQQKAVLAKEVQELKETLEVRNLAWGKGTSKPQEWDSCWKKPLSSRALKFSTWTHFPPSLSFFSPSLQTKRVRLLT